MSRCKNLLERFETANIEVEEKFTDSLAYQKVEAGKPIGYDAKGEVIVQPKTPKAQEKARAKVQAEAEKFADSFKVDNEYKENIVTLFLRFALTNMDNPKAFKKWMDKFSKAQKGSNSPYAPDGKSFMVNFAFDGKTFGDPKKLGKKFLAGEPLPMMDRKYRLTFNKLPMAKEIHTSSDLIAHDDYMNQLNNSTKVFIYPQNDKAGTPSDLRLAKAAKKLQDAGYSAEIVGDLDSKTFDRVFGHKESFNTCESLLERFEKLSEGKEDKQIKDMQNIIRDVNKDYTGDLSHVTHLDTYLDKGSVNPPVLQKKLDIYVKKNKIDTDALFTYWSK